MRTATTQIIHFIHSMSQKILFLDRDGTIIREPKDYQVDSFEKVSFVPYVIQSLARLAQAGFRFVMVTNQDGLGRGDYTWDQFNRVHHKVMDLLAGEGIEFDEVFIDNHTPEENHPNRKPGTGMLTDYVEQTPIDWDHSFMVGDRKTDAAFAENLGCRSITIKDARSTDGDARTNEIKQPSPTVHFTDWRAITRYLLVEIGEEATLAQV